jgi:acyl-CoA thioesterase
VSSTRFDRDTAVEPLAAGEFGVRLDAGWWIVVGPNGGYVAAILLNAFARCVPDPERAPRSLGIHYVSPGREGPARVAVRVERSGRTLTTLSARLEQDGRLLALALAAFARPRSSPEFADLRMPEVSPPEASRGLPEASGVPLRARLECRPTFGGPRGSGERALVGGWMRSAEPRVVDPAMLALFCDGWHPAVAQHRAFAGAPPRGMPTVDLTVHFRAAVPADARPEDFYLGVFRAQTLHAGFFEEDGEIWTRGGVLLAQSRQLGLLV